MPNRQQIHDDAALNFGTFELPDAEGKIDLGLTVKDFSNVKGFRDASLGKGVVTTVSFLLFSLLACSSEKMIF